MLIDNGAELNCMMRNSRGQLVTPLDVSLRRGNRGCAQFLQLHGGLAASKLTDSRALQKALNVYIFPLNHLYSNEFLGSF